MTPGFGVSVKGLKGASVGDGRVDAHDSLLVGDIEDLCVKEELDRPVDRHGPVERQIRAPDILGAIRPGFREVVVHGFRRAASNGGSAQRIRVARVRHVGDGIDGGEGFVSEARVERLESAQGSRSRPEGRLVDDPGPSPVALVGREDADASLRDVADGSVPRALLVLGVLVDDAPDRGAAVVLADGVARQVRPGVGGRCRELRAEPVLRLELHGDVLALELVRVPDHLHVVNRPSRIGLRLTGRQVDSPAVEIAVVPVEEIRPDGAP